MEMPSRARAGEERIAAFFDTAVGRFSCFVCPDFSFPHLIREKHPPQKPTPSKKSRYFISIIFLSIMLSGFSGN